MPFAYRGDIMARLKERGWSEYQIRKHKVLSAATIKSIKTGSTHISIRSLDEICHMLGDVSADSVIKYVKQREISPNFKSRQEYTDFLLREWVDKGGKPGPEMSAHITEQLKSKGFL